MSEIKKVAKEKIEAELKDFKGGEKEKIVSSNIATTLKNFCENEIFARAVIERGKTLSDCCSEIMKGVGKSISDIQLYRKAAIFYFPTAKIDFKMEILIDGEEMKSKEIISGTDRKYTSDKKDISQKAIDVIQLTLSC